MSELALLLFGALAVARRGRQRAQQRLRVDQRALRVVDRRRVQAAARVQAIRRAEAGRVGPREELARLPEREARSRLLVEQRREQRVRGERRARLVRMAGVPPHAAAAWIPAGCRDVRERALGVGQPTLGTRRAVGVYERQPPPAVVVEPCLCARAAIARIRRVARQWTQPSIEIALGARGKARDRRAVGRRRLRDRDRVERLKQRHDVPDRRQRVAVAVVQARVVPAQTPVAPAPFCLRHACLRERQVVLLGGRKRRGAGAVCVVRARCAAAWAVDAGWRGGCDVRFWFCVRLCIYRVYTMAIARLFSDIGTRARADVDPAVRSLPVARKLALAFARAVIGAAASATADSVSASLPMT